MKRFHWPLQRLYDVTAQRELALRSVLMRLLQQVARRRQQVVQRKAGLRSMLADLAEGGIERRLERQALVMDQADRCRLEIVQLGEQIESLTAERARNSAELTRLRKSKETLERMRDEARHEHVRVERNLEQKQFDETAQIAFARQAAGNLSGGTKGV